MFAGIGGFRSGLERVGGFECVGYCEIDKFAKQAYEALYDTSKEEYFDDATKIVPEELPDFDLMLVRKLIECIKVKSKTEITVIFKGGIETMVTVEK